MIFLCKGLVMESYYFLIVTFSLMVTGLSVMDKFGSTLLRTLHCCNGTLGYAAIPMVPCSSFTCCDEKETVTITPVNHALGYVFRCEKKENFLRTKCYKNGDVVVATNVTARTYQSKICCHGYKFKLQFNKDDIGLIVRCRKRRSFGLDRTLQK